MPFTELVEILARGLYEGSEETKESPVNKAIDRLFELRYHARHQRDAAVRDAYGLAKKKDDGVPFAGIIAPDNPPSGVYGGASLVWFPREDGTLLTFVVGTRGLAPDEGLLTRHGHRRRVAALRQHLSSRGLTTWSKPDPAATSTPIPDSIRRLFPSCGPVFNKYGEVIYSAVWLPKADRQKAELAIRAYFDVYARERGWNVRAEWREEYDQLIGGLHERLFERVSAEQIDDLLRARRFVILQGPPGTGKTRMAEQVRREFFGGRGRTVQFHPAVTYEDFVVGLAPDPTDTGLRFQPKPGWLLQAAQDAGTEPYLLIIDEINRGDLGRVLGEAIYLFEPGEVGAREVHLPHAVNGRQTLRLPDNLFVLGTMNTADRSIAGLDLAVRRRFAFVTVMPDRQVPSLPAAVDIFDRLSAVFVEHAPDDMLHLLPGHAYFMARDEKELRSRLRYELLPLIDEYLRQGLLGQAASDLYAVRDQISDFVSA
jgi:5-methylcytosine-specific restriction protein B